MYGHISVMIEVIPKWKYEEKVPIFFDYIFHINVIWSDKLL